MGLCNKASIIILLFFQSYLGLAQTSLCTQLNNSSTQHILDSLSHWQMTSSQSSWQEAICVHRKLARTVFNLQNKPHRALIILQSLESTKFTIHSADDRTLLVRYFTDLGYYGVQAERFDFALRQYDKAEHYFDDSTTLADDFLANYILTPRGNIHTRRGDYEKALLYLFQSNRILHSMGLKSNAGSLLTNIGLVYTSIEMYKTALDTFKSAVNLIQDDPYALLMARLNVAATYIKLREGSLAASEVEQILLLFSQFKTRVKPSDLHDFQIQAQLILVEAARLQNNFDLSDKLINEVEHYLIGQKPQVVSRDIAKMHIQIGNHYLSQNQFNRVRKHVNLAAKALVPHWNFGPSSYELNLDTLYAENTFAEIFDLQARVLLKLYHTEHDQAILIAIQSSYAQMFDVWDLLRKKYNYQSSHHIVLRENRNQIERALDNSFTLYTTFNDSNQYSRVFDLMRRAKNLLLQESRLTRNKLQSNFVPDSIRAISKKHTIEINQLKASIYRIKNQNTPQMLDSLETLLDATYEAEAALYHYVDNLVTLARNQFKFKSEFHQIRSLLRPEQQIIDYFIGDTVLFTLSYSSDQVWLSRKKIDTIIVQSISDMRTGILDYWYLPIIKRTQSNYIQYYDQYLQSANRLYNMLIEPIPFLHKEIIIVPDAELSHIPFELLLTKPHKIDDKAKKLSYLINDCIISYEFTTTFSTQKSNRISRFIGFGPSYLDVPTNIKIRDQRRSALGPLRWNKEEITTISSLIDGKKLIGQDASLLNFKKEVEHYNIIHLATHAKVDSRENELSFLAFTNLDSSESKLYLANLNEFSFDADMVVLSACESGLGPIQKGDGVASLARGFAEAGAKSLITSLWEVNDKATADIMLDFYQQLIQHKPKDVALRQAKLTYRNAQVEDHLAHPFYWAGFVAIGDTSALQFAQTTATNWWIYGLGVLLFLLFLYLSRMLQLAHKRK